jgi:hypothetical protein
VSPVVQALPSSHAAVLFVKTQPEPGSHVSVVQTSPSSQSNGAPPTQTAVASQESPVVQGFPSLQTVPTGRAVWVQPLAASHPSAVQTLPSSQLGGAPPRHAPPAHVSPTVQALPSLHGFALLTWTHPEAGLHESSVQGLASLHTVGAPGWHAPPPQVSPVVQAFPSSHAAVLFVWAQPVARSQVSVVQGLLSLQFGPGPETQAPPPHVSPIVHAFPSSQGLVLLTWTHPVAGLHESSVQGLLSSHAAGAPLLQTPPPQVSPVVQAFPSSHGNVLFVKTQPEPGLHVSVVQRSLSSQASVPAPVWQLPPAHVSPVVQAFPSSHGNVLFVNTQPVAGLHVSVVQAFPSLHVSGTPPTQTADASQASPVVQAFPSLQGLVLFVWTQPVAGSQESSVQGLLSLQSKAPVPVQTAGHESLTTIVSTF